MIIGCHQTAFTWDLNHVDKTDKWEIFRLNSDDIKKVKSKLSKYKIIAAFEY